MNTIDEPMEAWRKVWRTLAPMLPTEGLQALAVALETDDPRLIQGATTDPPPLMTVAGWECEGACLMAFPLAFGGKKTLCVGDAEEGFAKLCFDLDTQLGEPAAVRWLLNWFDETHRMEMIAQILPEVQLALDQRRGFHDLQDVPTGQTD